MRWYRNLYLGDNAKKAKYKVFGRIRKGRFTSDTFLITLPSSEENLLDITSANFLLQPYFKKKINLDKIYVVGLAKGREEALYLVRDIIDEVYHNTGGFDIYISGLGEIENDSYIASGFKNNRDYSSCYPACGYCGYYGSAFCSRKI